MQTNSARSADAEEICRLLEQAVLKYFPRPMENVDTFLFVTADDGPVGNHRSVNPPRAPTTTALGNIKCALSFMRFAHRF